MDASCSVDPLQRFASLQGNMGAHAPASNNHNHTHTNNHTHNFEHAFFHSEEAGYRPAYPSPVPSPAQTEAHAEANDDAAAPLLAGLAGVRIRDPLEFSDQYKRFYGDYAHTQQRSAQMHPNNTPHTHSTPHGSAATRPPIQRFRQFPQPRTVEPVPVPRVQGQGRVSLRHGDAALIDAQLGALERELQGGVSQREGDSDSEFRGSTPRALSAEQLQFREAATGIVHTLSEGNSVSNSAFPSPLPSPPATPLESRLGGSKFMRLMRQVSAGSVTLRSGSPELCSPDTDERVGSEYFPVLDEQ
ncbi:hypothetical protein DAKH74_016970 [Maudiozyma humilis]|uniref:PEX18/PEX21 C-terminal domain-containing protein n=1 Tax=Maudiozyma humilis TaxID=51915 RepID=A0AAV5RU67_MAUHU|nr:hypothetical protein DAKH74_016970 [Kazachstania humilis]